MFWHVAQRRECRRPWTHHRLEAERGVLCHREVADHPKALFRRATAHAALMNYEAAREDYELCKAVSPAMAKDVDRCVTPDLQLMQCKQQLILYALSVYALLWCEMGTL